MDTSGFGLLFKFHHRWEWMLLEEWRTRKEEEGYVAENPDDFACFYSRVGVR
jgi:hypothetical protein